MALKFIDDTDDCGSDAQAIDAIDYAAENGATLINASWGGTDRTTCSTRRSPTRACSSWLRRAMRGWTWTPRASLLSGRVERPQRPDRRRHRPDRTAGEPRTTARQPSIWSRCAAASSASRDPARTAARRRASRGATERRWPLPTSRASRRGAERCQRSALSTATLRAHRGRRRTRDGELLQLQRADRERLPRGDQLGRRRYHRAHGGSILARSSAAASARRSPGEAATGSFGGGSTSWRRAARFVGTIAAQSGRIDPAVARLRNDVPVRDADAHVGRLARADRVWATHRGDALPGRREAWPAPSRYLDVVELGERRKLRTSTKAGAYVEFRRRDGDRRRRSPRTDELGEAKISMTS